MSPFEHAAHLRVQVEKESQEECRGSLCKRKKGRQEIHVRKEQSLAETNSWNVPVAVGGWVNNTITNRRVKQQMHLRAWFATFCWCECENVGVVSNIFWLHQSEVVMHIVGQLLAFCS